MTKKTRDVTKNLFPLRVGERYNARNTSIIRIINEEWDFKRGENRFYGVVVSALSRKKQYYYADGKIFNDGRTHPLDIIARIDEVEEEVRDNISINDDKCMESNNNTVRELVPTGTLTDSEGREWVVADYSEDPESEGWLYLKPKPKRLTGWVNVYEDLDVSSNYVGRHAADEAAKKYASKRIACIDLSQFFVGHGLEGE